MVPQETISFKQLFFTVLVFLTFILTAIAIGILIDYAILGDIWKGASRPTKTAPYLLRMGLSAAVAMAFVLYLIRRSPTTMIRPLHQNVSCSREETPWFSISRKSRQISLLIVLLFSLIYLAIFLYDPIVFRDISSDEKPVENLSAIFAFTACFIFIGIGFINRKMDRKTPYAMLYPLISWLFAAVFFVIGMEEIAWTQGIFFFDTPKLFEANRQGEMNIHNFATYRFEMAYYFSTFIFLIVLPFYYDQRTSFQRIPVVSHFLPSRLAVYTGAMAIAYNYDMWDDINFQISFFLTLFILIYYVWIKNTDNHKILMSLLLITFFVSQASFFLLGDRVIRRPAFREYKEFFIPLTFVFYSLEILVRSKRLNKRGNK